MELENNTISGGGKVGRNDKQAILHCLTANLLSRPCSRSVFSWYKAEAAPPLRPVRLWPEHFSACRPVSRAGPILHVLSVLKEWRLFLVLVLGVPSKIHTSRCLFLYSHKIHQSALPDGQKNKVNFFFRASRGLSAAAQPLGFTAFTVPLPPLSL